VVGQPHASGRAQKSNSRRKKRFDKSALAIWTPERRSRERNSAAGRVDRPQGGPHGKGPKASQ
jgi:hypothetical protein